eukprot:390007-Prymnesium_polylepis.1
MSGGERHMRCTRPPQLTQVTAERSRSLASTWSLQTRHGARRCRRPGLPPEIHGLPPHVSPTTAAVAAVVAAFPRFRLLVARSALAMMGSASREPSLAYRCISRRLSCANSTAASHSTCRRLVEEAAPPMAATEQMRSR